MMKDIKDMDMKEFGLYMSTRTLTQENLDHYQMLVRNTPNFGLPVEKPKTGADILRENGGDLFE